MTRLHLCVVGRLRTGPERTLIDDYLDRAGKAGRAIGLGPVSVHEVEDRRGGGMSSEGLLLRKAVPDGAWLCCLDERGVTLDSPGLAGRLAQVRDDGRGDIAFVIGGADGIDPALCNEADLCLSFGPMVWPHMLARVMLAEQIYRAVSILGGSPYHRV